MQLSSLSINDLLDLKGFQCSCNKIHQTDLCALRIGVDALAELPAMLQFLQVHQPFLICDENTKKAAGETVEQLLHNASIPFDLFCFSANPSPLPDEKALGILSMHLPNECDFILGIGSGVINDLCKMLGRVARIPTGIVATAPSMDGYASNSAAMESEGVKTSIYTRSPQLVLCDLSILCNAPMEMLRSGLGDMLAKSIAICEWRISSMVTGEYYCEQVAQMMRAALKKALDSAPKLEQRDVQTVRSITEGLVLSGIAMSFSGISRPASGTEHTLSHLWEMIALAQGRRPAFHGLQVALGTRYVLGAYQALGRIQPSKEKAEKAFERFDEQAWAEDLRDVFGAQAEPMIQAAGTEQRNSKKEWQKRCGAALEHWSSIQEIISEELQQKDLLLSTLDALSLPKAPSDIGITEEDVCTAFKHGRDLRKRYILPSLLWDIGELDAIKI